MNKITLQDIHVMSSPRSFKTLQYLYKNKKAYAYEIMKELNEITYKNTRNNLQVLCKYGCVEMIDGYKESSTGRAIRIYQLSSKGKIILEELQRLLK